MSFNAQTKEDALAQYTCLSRSHDPNDKLLALGGILRFMRDADQTFLLRCARATDYQFLQRLMQSGMGVTAGKETNGQGVQMKNGIAADPGQLSQLGCAVLGVFAKLDEMKACDELVHTIPTLIGVLHQQYAFLGVGNVDARSGKERRDTLDTLQSLATTSQGAHTLLTLSNLQPLFKILENGTGFADEILSLIHIALGNASTTTSTLRTLKILSQTFATTKNPRLASSLLNFFISYFSSSPTPKSLSPQLYTGLLTLSLSNVDETTRTNTLVLLSLLLSHLGPPFLFAPPSSEIKPKQFALVTVRTASVGVQTGYNKAAEKQKEAEKQRLLACTEILHCTTAWLLSSDDETLYIGDQVVTPEETLQIQESLSSAFLQASGFLRARWDHARLVVAETGVPSDVNTDELVASTVKFVGGWLAEGGGSTEAESENIGLLEPLLGVCQMGDVEVMMWSMRGLRGILMYTEDASSELLLHRIDLVKLLGVVTKTMESRNISHEEMLMVREVTAVFTIVVDEQPLLLGDKEISEFPFSIVHNLSSERVDEDTWDARTDAALLGLEILLKVGETEGTFDRRGLDEWRRVIQLLIRVQRNQETRQDLEFLASTFEKMAL